MKFVKRSSLTNFGKSNPEDYVKVLDDDVLSLSLFTQGRVRFGGGGDGKRGENISGEFQVITTNASADTEDAFAHTLGSVPIGYIVLSRDKGGVIYDGSTSWTSTNIYLRSNVTSVATTIFLLK